MLRNLGNFARPFAQADSPWEVLDALNTIAARAGVSVFGLGRPPKAAESRSDVEKTGFVARRHVDLQKDWTSEFLCRGQSLFARYADANNPPPFTSVEAMRNLQPSGADRWVCDLLFDHGIKDSLWCAYGPWQLVYLSSRPLTPATLPDINRVVLDAAGAMAVHRLKELVLISEGRATLSPRERTVLLHLSDGLSISDIATRMKLGEPSIRTFVARAARKLGAKSQLHTVATALRRRII